MFCRNQSLHSTLILSRHPPSRSYLEGSSLLPGSTAALAVSGARMQPELVDVDVEDFAVDTLNQMRRINPTTVELQSLSTDQEDFHLAQLLLQGILHIGVTNAYLKVHVLKEIEALGNQLSKEVLSGRRSKTANIYLRPCLCVH